MAKKITIDDLAVLISDLSSRMQSKWEPEVFFADLLRMYGTANTSIEMALQNVSGYNVASKQVDDTMARPDLAISLRAYFRFLKNDVDVAPALDKLKALKEVTSPKHKFQYLICSGPTTLVMFDTVEHDQIMISYKDLPSFYSFMLPLLEGRRAKIVSTQEADRKACLKLTRLLDTLAEHNDITHDNMKQLNSFMVRILFCFFAEDTNVFDMNGENVFSNAFNKLVSMDGSNAKQFFTDLFTVLNTKESDRAQLDGTIAHELLCFPYVNGGLFADIGYIPDFDIVTRNQFTDCGHLSWSKISPAVFGAMFQGAMDREERRNMGAHYTSEENILKVIKPLFLDDLRSEFESLKQLAEPLKDEAAIAKRSDTSRRKSFAVRCIFFDFLERIGKMKFLDPACGCGNFLLVTYKELRTLENEVFEFLNEGFFTTDSFININQFYGIEIEDWPVEIAHVSMWLMQHLMNQQANATFGANIQSIPLKSSATIVCANALTTDWNTILPAADCSFIIGNPPFGGNTYMTAEQRDWVKRVYPNKYILGKVDFVTAWFVKASDYMLHNKDARAAFVSTNSICQGQQVETLWGLLLDRGIHINFAYRPFQWSNGTSGKAAVTCVIVGFSYRKPLNPKMLWIENNTKYLQSKECKQISPYLIDCESPVIVTSRRVPFNTDINLQLGNSPYDGGHLVFSYEYGQKFLADNPDSEQFIKRFIGSHELMNSEFRYCLWLKEEDRDIWSSIPKVIDHVNACAAWRANQVKSGDSYKLRDIPWSFRSQHNHDHTLVIPRVTSEKRKYMPIGFFSRNYIVGDSAFSLPDATPYDFAVLTSLMHNVWIKFSAGRLESRIRYSRDMTFNTFVWPKVTKEQHDEIEKLGKNIIILRVDYEFAGEENSLTLGEMYNPETMPEDLKAAHELLDAAVERAYRAEPFKDDEERLSFLLGLYTEAINAEKAEGEEAAAAKPKAKTRTKKSS